LTYVAVAGVAGTEVRRHLWHGNRAENKLRSAEAALGLLLDRLGEGTEG
jgi:nicotinamide mononucleotide (NMN) deamidase PncC